MRFLERDEIIEERCRAAMAAFVAGWFSRGALQRTERSSGFSELRVVFMSIYDSALSL